MDTSLTMHGEGQPPGSLTVILVLARSATEPDPKFMPRMIMVPPLKGGLYSEQLLSVEARDEKTRYSTYAVIVFMDGGA